MAKPQSPDEKKAVCLRTTASVMEHALKQMMYCGVAWPEYMDDATAMRHTVEKIVEHARQLGYVGDGK